MAGILEKRCLRKKIGAALGVKAEKKGKKKKHTTNSKISLLTLKSLKQRLSLSLSHHSGAAGRHRRSLSFSSLSGVILSLSSLSQAPLSLSLRLSSITATYRRSSSS
jgi:hypothetical protein